MSRPLGHCQEPETGRIAASFAGSSLLELSVAVGHRPLEWHLLTVERRTVSSWSMLPVQLGFAGMLVFAWVFDWLMGNCGPVWG